MWWLQSPRIPLPGAAIAALAIAVVPHYGEIYLTISNLQWIVAIALFALSISDDATQRSEHIGDIALLILAGLTGPFILLSLPLFAWRAWQKRSRPSAIMLALAVACAAAHAPSLLHRHVEEIAQPLAPLHYTAIVGRRLIAALFLGQIPLGEYLCRALTLIAGLGLTVTLWRRRSRVPGAPQILAALVAVLLATAYKARIDTWNVTELFNGDRYFFIPQILLIWLIAAIAATSAFPLRAALTLLLASVVVVNASRFRYPPFADKHWRDHAESIERGIRTNVPILPEGFGFTHPGRRR